MLSGAVKDQSRVDADGAIRRDLIAGVQLKEIRNVVTRNGVTTELYRFDWNLGTEAIGQALHVALRGGAISAWHCHEMQTDHIIAIHGAIRLVLYDARPASHTLGKVDVFDLSPMRPLLIVVPPGIWHGIQNLMPDTSAFANFLDRAYDHGNPDEWRLPPDTGEIPYRF